MAFEDRIVENPGRVVLTPVSGQTNTYDADYTSAEGTVTQEGTLLNADGMNEAVQDLIDASINGITLSAGGTLTVRNIQGGKMTITPVANAVTQKTVTFATAFENVPYVVACPQSAAPQNVSVGVDQITTTGFRISIYRTNTTSTVIQWHAIGV